MAGAASADTIPADPQVAAAQALLRNDRLYRGKINGTADTETEAAIRRFQMTYGLRATGRLDEPTVTAMGLPRFTPAPSTLESDRRFLRDQTAAASPPPVRERTVAPPRAVPRSEAARRDVSRFLETFLGAAGEQDSAKELSFFADSVDYFDQGRVNRESLEGVLDRSRAVWPSRKFELLDLEPVTTAGDPEMRIRFTVRFENSNGLRRRAGIERQEAVIVKTGNGSLRLAALHTVAPGAPSRMGHLNVAR